MDLGFSYYLENVKMTILVQWADTENHRHVQFTIHYSIMRSAILIESLKPIKVTFACPQTNTMLRTIGVHTGKGQELLNTHFMQSVDFEDLLNLLATKHGLMAAS